MRNNKKRNGKKSNLIITGVIVLFVIFLCVFFKIQTDRISAQNKLDQEKIDKLNKELTEEQNRSEELAAYEKYVNTKQFIEEIARSRLKLVYPGEIIFKPENK